MAILKKDENLFEESTMSFGEHLEELRLCLWYCIMWLAGGFIIGLFFGGAVVRFIQQPLNEALERFRTERSTALLVQESEKLKALGYPDWVASIPKEKKLSPEMYYVFPGQIESLLHSDMMLLEPSQYQADPRGVDNMHLMKERIGDKLPGTGQNPDPGDELDKVDNLIVQKQRLIARKAAYEESQREEMKFTGVNFDEDPRVLVLFRKIDADSRNKSTALNSHEAFSIYIKASLLFGFVIASPGIFYHLWAFVASGLYMQERKYVYMFMPISILLFLSGTALAFYFVFAYVLDFLMMFNAWLDIDPTPRINEWISFAIMLPVGFGISFQLPLVMLALERVGIFSVEQYLSHWKVSVLAIFFVSMLLTPADPWSLLLMAIPLTFLYFGGVFMCKYFPRKKSEFYY